MGATTMLFPGGARVLRSGGATGLGTPGESCCCGRVQVPFICANNLPFIRVRVGPLACAICAGVPGAQPCNAALAPFANVSGGWDAIRATPFDVPINFNNGTARRYQGTFAASVNVNIYNASGCAGGVQQTLALQTVHITLNCTPTTINLQMDVGGAPIMQTSQFSQGFNGNIRGDWICQCDRLPATAAFWVDVWGLQ